MTQKEQRHENAKRKVTWIDPSDPSIYHIFSPKKHGLLQAAEKVNKNWKVNLEDGWMIPEQNKKRPSTEKLRTLTNEDGTQYRAGLGPARGKFIAFDAWQSNEELMTIYKMAFEEPYKNGSADSMIYDYTAQGRPYTNGALDYTGNRIGRKLVQNWKGDGHIKEVSYNSSLECMMVNFENKDSVVCYLGVPQGTVDMLRECVGKVRAGHGKHNHMLGVKFWDYVRVRGTQHGSRYPFWYVTDEQGHTYASTVSKLKQGEIADYMKKLQMQNIARLNNYSIEQRGAYEYIIDLDVILNSPRFNDMYNSGAEIPGVDIDKLDEMMERLPEVQSAESDKVDLAFVKKYKDVINPLRKLFAKELKEDLWGGYSNNEEIQKIEKEGKENLRQRQQQMRDSFNSYQIRKERERELKDVRADKFASMSPSEFEKYKNAQTAELLGELGEKSWQESDLNKSIIALANAYDAKHPQGAEQTAAGVGRGTNWKYNYNDKSFYQWRKENPESYENWRKAQASKKKKGDK